MMDFQAARYLMDGDVPKQAGNNHPTGIPTGVFSTTDGLVNIQAGGGLYKRLCKALDIEHLVTDDRFATPALRLENRDTLNSLIDEATRGYTSADLIERLAEAGVPCGPINTVDQTFADPQVQTLGMTPTVEHPRRGTLRLVGQAIGMSRTPSVARSATPDAGQHTDEVLREAGYDDEAIAKLRADSVI